MELKKVYPGLKEVDRASTYHLGHYEVAFPDGDLRFQLHARLCPDLGCPCDNLALAWHADGRVTHTWYTGERTWLDASRKPLAEELVGVFGIVEKTEVFQERYSLLVYLRRKQVLAELERLDGPFTVRLPHDLLDEGADPAIQSLGRVRPGAAGGKHLPYALEFCGDEACFCNHLFVVLVDGESTVRFCVDAENHWTCADPDPEAARLLTRVEPRLMKREVFQRQLAFLRGERRLHNYHRYVARYAQIHKIR